VAAETTLHLVRHGRTALNAQGRFRGLEDPPLDEAGLAEVATTAERLRGREISHIATSRLRRAVQTAEACAHIVGVDPLIDPGLLDVDMGAWTALSAEEASARDPEAFAIYRTDPRRAIVPDGDALATVERRVRGCLDHLATRFEGREIVAVSHEAPIKLVVSGVLGVDGSDVWALDLPTASLTTLLHGDGGWAFVGTSPGADT
jgi:ribonuclease H / adenosylcobalamin/alpha-ribazole phosphatase